MKTILHIKPATLLVIVFQLLLFTTGFSSNGNNGITLANPGSICIQQNVNLSISGVQCGFGRTYQWQKSSNNFNWTNISGAVSATAVVNVTASTWFRCIVSYCGNSNPTQSAFVLFQNTIINTLPHNENFDLSANLPCGWSTQNVNNDNRSWKVSGINPRSFPRAVRYKSNECQSANDWLFSPGIELQQGLQYRVKFWYRAATACGQEKLRVRFGQTANAAGMNSANIFSNFQINNTNYQQAVSATFSPSQSGVVYIGFHVFSQANQSGLILDDFCIEQIGCNLATPIITSSGSNEFCEGDSVTLTSSAATGNLWSNGSTQGSITVSESGNYSVTVTDGGCTASSNTIQVTVHPIPVVSISAAGPTTFCDGGSVMLTSSSPNNIVWNTGETNQSISVSQTGIFSVSVNENGCSSTSNPIVVSVNPIPIAQIVLNGSPEICLGDSILLQSENSNGNLWSNGSNSPSVFVTQAGIYYLTVTENNCTSIPDSIEITAQNCVPLTALDATSCGNMQLTLNNSIAAQAVSGATSYEFIITDANDQISIGNYISNSNVLTLNSTIPALSPSFNYVIRVRALVNGVWGIPGPPCTIGIVPVVVSAPTTKLNSTGCGNQGLTPYSSLVAIPVVGATQYEFIVLNQNGTFYANRIQSSASLNLSVLNPALNWGTAYWVTVRIFYAGNWGLNGDTCAIATVPNPEIFGVPLTSLRSQDCNRTNYLSNSSVVAIAVTGANQYEFEFRDVNNLNTVYCSRVQPGTTLSFTNLNPVLQTNTQYSVRVRASIAGIWGQFGNVCTIGFQGSSRVSDDEPELEADVVGNIGQEKINSVHVYPNPFKEELQSSIEDNFEMYRYSVIDVTGRQIVAETLLTGKSIAMPDPMKPGIYWLIIRNQEGEVSNHRIIKQ